MGKASVKKILSSTNDEDLAASLEAFELGYYQKHAFNNYGSRFYHAYPGV